MSSRGLLFILSAPAGTGKTTLVEELLSKMKRLRQSISYTTRPKRPQEIDGKHYHFITEEEFLQKIESGDFLEHVEIFGYRYGTSKSDTEKVISAGYHLILVIDIEGAKKIRTKVPAITIFLLPPSIEALRDRLSFRKTEKAADIEERLRVAINELNQRKWYDYQVTNDRLEDALLVAQSIIVAEEHRTPYIET